MAAISPLSTESLAKRTTSINDAIARVTSAATAYAEITKKGLDDDGGSSSRNNSNITPTAEATAQGQARIQAQEALTVQARRLLAEVQGPMGAIFDLLGTTCRLAALRCLLEVGVFAALPADGTALTVDALLARLPPRDVGRHHEQGGEGGGGGKIEKELLVRLLRNAAVPGWGPLVEVGEETYALDVSTSTVRGNSSSLAAGGVVGAPAPGAGAMLMTSPHATAVLKQMFDESIPALVALPGFFRENGWVVPREPRNCPYTYAHRTGGRVMWDHIALFPERQANCNAAMRAESFDGVWGVGLYPFCERLSSSSYPSSSSSSGGGEEGRVLVVDVGGGAGHTSRKIRELCGGLKGTVVLQDREEVVVDAEDVEGVLKMAHNFFEEQPVKGAHIYYLRRILHDWADDSCVAILKHLAAAMDRTIPSCLVIAEQVLPTRGVGVESAFVDMVMMTFTGMERTEAQWAGLLGRAGLRIEGVYRAPGTAFGAIEAVLA